MFYPFPFNLFVQAIEVFALNLFGVFHAECVGRANYNEQLVIAFMTLVALGVLAVALGAAMKRWSGSGTVVNSSPVTAWIYLIYLILPSMSTMAISAFDCDEVGGGG